MRITLTPGQGVLAHGWVRAREHITWGDVLNSDKLTFSYLADYVEISLYSLYQLQPDLQSWIKHHKARLEDCPRMAQWQAHPIRDFHADLADLVRMRWDADEYKRMGITYDDMKDLGLTPETMMLFGFTLNNWISIGFTRKHCEHIPDYIVFKLFCMNKTHLMSFLR